METSSGLFRDRCFLRLAPDLARCREDFLKLVGSEDRQNPVLLSLGVFFCFLAVFRAAEFLGLFECFLLVFQWFLRVRKVREILGAFEVFLGIFEKTKEKKDRGRGAKLRALLGEGGGGVQNIILGQKIILGDPLY